MQWLSELAPYAHPRELRWDPVLEPVAPRAPTAREQAILSALASLRVLSSRQIHRRFMPGATERTVRHQLAALAATGWVRRAHLLCAGAGQTPRLYFAAESEVPGPSAVVGLLHRNAWLFAFEHLARVVCVRRGPFPTGLAFEVGDRPFLLELDRAPRRLALRARFRRYEPHLSSAAAIFVLPDEPTAIAAARLAHGVVGHSARASMFFASEPDVHHGRLRALTLATSTGGFRPSLRDLATPLPEVPRERDRSGKPPLGSGTDSDSAGRREATQ